MIRDEIIIGTNSLKVREKLINQGSSLTLNQAADIAKIHELPQAQLTSMSQNGADSTVHAVAKNHKKHRYGMKPLQQQPQQKHPQQQRQQGQVNSGTRPQVGVNNSCGNCGFTYHSYGKCPAQGRTCHKCQQPNRFSRMCRANGSSRHKAYSVDSQSQVYDQEPYMYIESINNQKSDRPDQVFVDLEVTPTGHHRPYNISFKLDTGAQVSILTMKAYQLPGEPELEPTTQCLFSYSGDKLDVIGKRKILC